MESLVVPVVVGIAVGLVVGALGAGGGILMFPVLVFLLDQDPHSAAASSAVIVGLSAAVSIVHHARRGAVAWADGAVFGGIGVIGTIAGSRLAALVPAGALLVLFGSMLAVIAVVMVRRGRQERRLEDAAAPEPGGSAVPESAPQGRRWGRLISTASLTGLVTGLFGVGGGFLVLPMLVLAMGLPMRRASGTSLLVMIISTSVSILARFGTPVEVDWRLTLELAGASMLGGIAGGPLASRARPSTLTLLFGLLLGAVAAVTLAQVVAG